MPRRIKGVGKSAAKAIYWICWIIGILVSLAVGFGMIDGTLTIPYIADIVPVAGWIVVILTIIGAVMAIIEASK